MRVYLNLCRHLNLTCRVFLSHVLAAAVFAFFSGHTEAQTNEVKDLSISVCDDENEWPPYTYYQRVDGKKTTRISGFSIDVIDEIFSRNRISYSVSLLPWARCLAEVNNGKRFQMVLDLSRNEERNTAYWMTRPYYFTSAYYFYSKKQHPQGLPIRTAADLKRFRACGLQGYNYTLYGFFKEGEVDQGTKDFNALIAKLHARRCDLFMEQYEAMLGFGAIGNSFLSDPNLGREPIPDLSPTYFHFGISRKFPGGQALKNLIDKELLQMEASGRLKELWKKAVSK